MAVEYNGDGNGVKSSTVEFTIEILLERDSGVINSKSFIEFLRFNV